MVLIRLQLISPYEFNPKLKLRLFLCGQGRDWAQRFKLRAGQGPRHGSPTPPSCSSMPSAGSAKCWSRPRAPEWSRARLGTALQATRRPRTAAWIADAAELQLNAERRLGEMLVKAKAAGQVVEGRPRPGAKNNYTKRVQLPRVTAASATAITANAERVKITFMSGPFPFSQYLRSRRAAPGRRRNRRLPRSPCLCRRSTPAPSPAIARYRARPT